MNIHHHHCILLYREREGWVISRGKNSRRTNKQNSEVEWKGKERGNVENGKPEENNLQRCRAIRDIRWFWSEPFHLWNRKFKLNEAGSRFTLIIFHTRHNMMMVTFTALPTTTTATISTVTARCCAINRCCTVCVGMNFYTAFRRLERWKESV